MERIQKVSVGGFLLRDGKALIIRRSEREEQLAGYYELPGGKVEFGDDPADTVEREFHEETGLEVSASEPYFVLSYVHPSNAHRIEIVYLVTSHDRGAVILSDEHDEHLWVDADELATCIASNNVRMTEEMQAIISTGFEVSGRTQKREDDNAREDEHRTDAL